MTDRPMSTERRGVLLKVAEECIGLMNMGVNASGALAKLADDNGLNDHEVERVAEAVNNAAQLAHIQQAKGDSKGDSIPLVDTAEAKKLRDHL